jgi:hypothetical protein
MSVRIESTLRLENDSSALGEGWWKWSVWVEGSDEDLTRVESVVYRLHPTFPKPVIEIADATTKFRLSSAGWGEFAIAADARMKDGRTLRLERWLRLGDAKDTSGERRRPVVFLSYSVADAEIVRPLSDALVKQGIDVRTAGQSADTFLDVVPSSQRELEGADAVVAILSDPPSRWVEQEALAAHSKGRYVLPVLVGGAKAHGALSSVARFELPDAKNVEGLAHQIVARVKDHVIPDEV